MNGPIDLTERDQATEVVEQAMQKSLAQRIRDWDDYVEDHDREEAVRPFDAGIMLAVAKVLEVYDGPRDVYDERFAGVMDDLRETAEAVVEGSGAEAEEEDA